MASIAEISVELRMRQFLERHGGTIGATEIWKASVAEAPPMKLRLGMRVHLKEECLGAAASLIRGGWISAVVKEERHWVHVRIALGNTNTPWDLVILLIPRSWIILRTFSWNMVAAFRERSLPNTQSPGSLVSVNLMHEPD
jgi:hypothetical protein